MFNFPHNKRPGTSLNSIMFIAAMMIICVMAANLAFRSLIIQIAIIISLKPIRMVIARAYDELKMFATI